VARLLPRSRELLTALQAVAAREDITNAVIVTLIGAAMPGSRLALPRQRQRPGSRDFSHASPA
jgi:hypothetical protein